MTADEIPDGDCDCDGNVAGTLGCAAAIAWPRGANGIATMWMSALGGGRVRGVQWPRSRL